MKGRRKHFSDWVSDERVEQSHFAIKIFQTQNMLSYTFEKYHLMCSCSGKRVLKILKGKSDSVNRRTEHTMAIRKRTKGQTTIY